jgi:plastocyanin
MTTHPTYTQARLDSAVTTYPLPSLAGLLAVTLQWMSAVRRLPWLLVPLALAAALLAACSADNVDPAAAATVKADRVVAKDNRFDPVAVEVPAGTTITWSFEDRGTPHDVTGGGWKSGEPQSEGSYSHAFDRPGTYPYRCTLHAGMDGRVVVTGS